jgi:protein-disulfide isomerase
MTLTLIRPALMRGIAAAASLAMIGLPLAAKAQDKPATDKPAFTDQQKAAIGAIVRDYLVQNPEVIQEALAELDTRQKQAEKTATQKALGEVQATLINSPRNIVIGNPTGDVTMVEFFDYNCGYCKRSLSDIRDLVKADPKLRVVIRDFPVLGPDSVEASFVAVAARNQLKGDKYFEFHQKLLESKGRVGKDRAMSVAKDLGLDLAKLQKDMDSPDTRAAIEETMKIGDRLKLQGTPAFVVGDEIIFGSVGLDPLRASVTNVRQCGKAACG